MPKKSTKHLKIIFGVAGEGLGHAARASIIIRHLESQGHIVKVLTYHQGFWSLTPEFDATEIFGLRFSHKNGETTYPGTLLDNIKKTPKATKSFTLTKKLVETFQPDIIMTDLEPLSSLCSYLYEIPLISIDNQHRITQGEIEYNKKWLLDYLLNKTAVATVAFNARSYIITSFFDFKITQPNSYLVPPILREEILKAQPTVSNHILIYTTTEDINSFITLLNNRPEKFIIYGPNLNKRINNCTFKKRSKSAFLRDLLSARAVIASAGITLMTEAMHLGKPFLALPVKKRIEQLVNAYYLKKLDYGDYSEKLTAKELDNFFNNISRYRQNLRSYKKLDNSKLYKLLDSILEEYF